ETEEDKKIDLGIQIQIINRDISVINQQEREENLRHLELKLRIANQRLEQVTENFEQEGKTEEQIKNDASVQQLTRLIAGFESATEQEETAYESHRTEAAEARQQAEILKFEKNNYFLRSVAVMTALLKGYREFSGLAQLSSLFINDEELDKRRNQIDEQFCESILFGGTKCWTSKICDGYIDTTPQGSTLITKGPSKTPFGFVHLEAEKSLPMHTVQEGRKTTLFQYKVTYSITNPLDKPMFYNLEFASTDKTVKIFTEDKIIEKETFDGKLGSDALIPPLSKTDYTSICLTWTPAITSFDGKRETRFCVPISQYEGAATKPYGQTTTVPVTGKQVTIQGFRYSPNIITIDEGESITWTNQDDTGHTVTIMQGPETFDSGEIAPGQQFSYTFTKPGTYSYECSIHTAMKGSIRVNPEAVRPTTPTPEKKEDFRNF
ncbi:MAG: cupredoxin family copper-binding protein, partial [Candidatus Aenigmarchaeota archaeon]|nr:cupredoxin family copper-binding protein [Candidatus Aenigmarchaeota archaeon]